MLYSGQAVCQLHGHVVLGSQPPAVQCARLKFLSNAEEIMSTVKMTMLYGGQAVCQLHRPLEPPAG